MWVQLYSVAASMSKNNPIKTGVFCRNQRSVVRNQSSADGITGGGLVLIGYLTLEGIRSDTFLLFSCFFVVVVFSVEICEICGFLSYAQNRESNSLEV